MRNKIFVRLVLLITAVMIICGIVFLIISYNLFTAEVTDNLQQSASYISAALNETDNREDYLRSFGAGNIRITLISGDGTVLYDNFADESAMDNHLDRPEVKDAINNMTGKSSRRSDTLSQRTHYYAVLLSDGSVLRLAETRNSVFSLVLNMLFPFIIAVFVIFVISFYLAKSTSDKLVKPINELDLTDPLSNNVYEELSPLLTRIDKLFSELNEKTGELARHQQDFTALINTMQEGFILLDSNRKIISVNNSVCGLFHVSPQNIIGHDLLNLSRDLTLSEITVSALEGTPKDMLMEIDSKSYSFITSPTKDGENTIGCIILVIDITERQNAEKLRREFSANVSHELKTPLQSISGYAEIIEYGIAKEADVRRFSSKIREEANRMTALIEDIMKISRLDEGVQGLPREEIDLLFLVNDVAASFKDVARANKITVSVEGEHLFVNGVKTILTEMLMNLVDNAVKYNVPEGSVTINLTNRGGSAVLSVADTGIGIPEEHIPRVFERFYRVDKSRSREAGGTGLGLSIVKHGALIHNAKLEIESTAGKGTVIRVVFE